MNTHDIIQQTETFSANNYHPLPIVLARGEGIWVWDVDGKKYMDCLSAYSALNQGHRHPAIIKTLIDQAGKVTLTSRAFHNDQMGPMLKRLCEVSNMEMALPMNTGAEAVETAIKTARKWGYKVKKVAEDKAEIIICRDNFHGRTVTIVSCSTEHQYRDGFGPFTPGFKVVDFGDAAQLEKAITPNTVAFLVEPIQGEAGILMPSDGYLTHARELCTKNNVLLIVDEIQTGLGRTGKMFAYEHEKNAKPDMIVIGKALGGGVYPVSAVVSSKAVLGVFNPGDHGSTFGGNPLGAAVARTALDVIVNEKLVENSRELGTYLLNELKKIPSPHVQEIRGRGLFIGVEIKKSSGRARPFCEKLMNEGMLAKETHDQVIRLAPPLIIKKDEIDWIVSKMNKVLS
ncbi:MAG: ornithine--oxo-acid transaminase [Bdellovibrionales bacterium GWC1_52_8]|nr:MAG: ornithine--oxo-acid transaminase [Bdellovibrionales bacterium GWB1_52_6]OFZ04271.1 MAG: ornithine--oxo-acid transaminase [Bdellovibrionales bacterium GWA1_52_35]OFZ43524.1 MAG: ornithine--oxo-acid transaminase [Bdellovibrionales bacterium GWC1_52_8]HCM40882.1 ornithine--oxo-acid transaminase [Bdellovibrionales bacterium]